MREIKSRGKRADNGEWSYGDLIQLLGKQGNGRMFIVDNRFGACIDSDGSFVNTEAPFVNEVDPETVGQSTGLIDNKGREIFESDQLWATGNLTDDLHYVGTVVWDEDDARFEVKSIHGRFEYVPSDVVVKGTVWDDEELGGEGADTE
ncbi:YopX family protein [Paenibacillus illinoisensis]|uniref:YopX family protein n=1 Tax=Paenibacillus illinoisensis TaxID=59845 RepID=UPI00203C4D86|nr:YopX family protein [Paenibacillus illinoisensis]MCM3208509.1 YopX family protein [Paenibacillus illinoisensis]